jgi:hypothetical protein
VLRPEWRTASRDKLLKELELQQREIERLRREHERADQDRNREDLPVVRSIVRAFTVTRTAPEDLVFGNGSGKPLRESKLLRDVVQPAAERAGGLPSSPSSRCEIDMC